MASYPAIPFSGRFVPRTGRVKDFVGDGTARFRTLHPDKGAFELTHPLITTAQAATILAFYAANETIVFDFTFWDGVTYQVRFDGRPEEEWVNAARRTVQVRFELAT